MGNSQKHIDHDKLLRYLENGASQDDAALNAEEQELLHAYMSIKEGLDLKEWAKADTDEGWKSLSQRIEQQDPSWIVARPKVRYLWRYAAAVAVLLLAGAGWYFFRSADKQTPAIVDNVKTAKVPAGITLLTAEGNEIVLDTLRQLKGAATASNEELIYQPGEGTAAHVTNNTLTIPRGYTYHLVLSDGTKVWLNADTRLKYPSLFAKDTRLVNVEGEAYFEVAEDASRPFMVQHTHGAVKVLGTAFNINTYEGNIVATLVEGKISVQHEDNSTILQPGQQLVSRPPYDNAQIRKVDTEIYTAWKDGELIFADATLEEICKRLERIYNYRIILPEGQIRYRKIEANLPQYKEISTITELLEKMTDVHFNVNQKERTITGYVNK